MLGDELKRQKALFAGCDAVALVAAILTTWAVHGPFGVSGPLRPATEVEVWAAVIVIVTSWILVAHTLSLYKLHKRGLSEVVAIVKTSSMMWVTILVIFFLAHLEPSRIAMGLAYFLTIAFPIGARTLIRLSMRRLYRNPAIAIPIVIVGWNRLAEYVRDRILQELSQYEFVGFIEVGSTVSDLSSSDQIVGNLEQLPSLAKDHPNLEAALILPDSPIGDTREVIDLCDRCNVRWHVMPPPLSSSPARLAVDMVGVVPLIRRRSSNLNGLNYILKRAFDTVAAALIFVVVSPVLGLALVALWLLDGRPLLFRQTRVGVHGKPFELLKLRTMRAGSSDEEHREYVKGWIGRSDAPANGKGFFKLTADPRITRIGRLLRRFSVDELPQLINVLCGEMSLIGPRPALPYEIELYCDWHRQRLQVPPGITGLWQVSGRNELAFDEMVRLDIEYIQSWSLARDLGILLRTVPVLLRGNGL